MEQNSPWSSFTTWDGGGWDYLASCGVALGCSLYRPRNVANSSWACPSLHSPKSAPDIYEGGPLAAMLVNEPISALHHNRLDKGWTRKPLSWDVDLCPTSHLQGDLKHVIREAQEGSFLMY